MKKQPAYFRLRRHSIALALLIAFLSVGLGGNAQRALSPRELKKLSVEELMNIEVTLVSRTPQKLTEAASAIQVITGEDIRRSGATNVPEALRLVTNVQVAQITSSAWIISSRGFNTIFANKLLVMIDGRTIYTPLFGGVIWEQQNVLLEDVDRIEVVSGPGGTLWGANAVNGVINIVTKTAKESTGVYAMVSAGSFVKDMAALRYGSKLGNKLFYKVYGMLFDRKETSQPNGTKNTDAWRLGQGGFKLDWNSSEKNTVTLQGDYYDGTRKTTVAESPLNGQNIIGRWMHTISDKSNFALQLYYDQYFREDAPTSASDELTTFDADFQHHFALKSRQNILWGLGYRIVHDDANYRTTQVGILPRKKSLNLFNSFIQDEISIAHNLKLTVGTKLLHNVYTGFELQPSGRLAWTKNRGTLWGAVSRAVRTPSRYDVDFYLPTTLQPPNIPSVAGGPNFVSEKLLAYELGYRFQPTSVSSFSIAGFYNRYSDVYSVEALPGTFTYQIQNGAEGKSWGAELSGAYQLFASWRMRGGYTFFKKELKPKPGHIFNPDYLGNDVKSQVMIQSILDLPQHLQFDVMARYLDPLPKTIATEKVPDYFTFDTRIAYVIKGFEFAITGQNLRQKKHPEFGTSTIPRSVYVKLIARF